MCKFYIPSRFTEPDTDPRLGTISSESTHSQRRWLGSAIPWNRVKLSSAEGKKEPVSQSENKAPSQRKSDTRESVVPETKTQRQIYLPELVLEFQLFKDFFF